MKGSCIALVWFLSLICMIARASVDGEESRLEQSESAVFIESLVEPLSGYCPCQDEAIEEDCPLESASTASLRCSPTPITQAITIATSGAYQIVSPISGQIIITASDVTLDLGGFAVTAQDETAIVVLNANNIVIRNGFVISSGLLGNGNGIVVENCTNLVCSDLIMTNQSGNSIVLVEVFNAVIQRCLLNNLNSAQAGVFFDSQTSQCLLQGCQISNYSFSGVVVGVQAVQNVINQCVFLGNVEGIIITDATALNTMLLNNYVTGCSELGISDGGTNTLVFGTIAANNALGDYSSNITLTTAPSISIGPFSNLTISPTVTLFPETAAFIANTFSAF